MQRVTMRGLSAGQEGASLEKYVLSESGVENEIAPLDFLNEPFEAIILR